MKTLKYFWVCILILSFTSCDSFLDIEPAQQIDSGVALNTSENVEMVLVSAYPIIRNAYARYLFHASDLLTDNGEIAFQGTYSQPRDLLLKSLVADFAWAESPWRRAYRGIDRVNTVLANLAIVDESKRDFVEGQAKFLRGLMYFDMARFYGNPYEPGEVNDQLAVPLVLTPITGGVIEYPVRATVEQVFDQAIADLQDAKTKMAGVDESFYANEFAAAAILSRIYLQKGMYAEAAVEANYVIVNGGYELASTPFDAFNNESNGSEDIFTFQQNNDDNAGEGNDGMAAFYASTDETGRSDFTITNVELDKYETGDLRGNVQTGLDDGKIGDVTEIFYEGFGPNAAGGIFCGKWLDFKTNITFIRLAEMYLTRAEGNFEAGTTVGATPLADINEIRDRAGLTPLGTVTQADIRNERMLELAFEGFKIHDIKRWNLNVGTLTYDDPVLVLPIPKREMDVNKNLIQNEAYL